MNRQLLDAIYQGATELPPWRGFVQQLCELCRCQAVSFILRMPRLGENGVVFSYNADKRYEKRFLHRFSHRTPFRSLPVCVPRRLDEILSREELLASEYYRDLLRPAATEYILGMNLPGAGEEPSLLTLSRTAAQGNFGELERELLEQIAEHLCRALAIYLRVQDLAGQTAVFSDALDHLGIGAIILNRRGVFLGANATALELLQQVGLDELNRGCAGQLLGEERVGRFEAMLSESLTAYEQRDLSVCSMMTVPAARGRSSLHLLVRPSVHPSAMDNYSAPAVCVFVSLPGRIALPSPDIVRELFGFSRAESAVVCLLLNGKTAKEIAYEQGISLSTVRSHIKSVFVKAGVGRQSELVASVLRSIALLA